MEKSCAVRDRRKSPVGHSELGYFSRYRLTNSSLALAVVWQLIVMVFAPLGQSKNKAPPWPDHIEALL